MKYLKILIGIKLVLKLNKIQVLGGNMEYKDCQVYILDNNQESIDNFHEIGWCKDNVELTLDQVVALLNGKAIGWSDGETTHVITLKK